LLEAFAIKERDNLGLKPEKISRFRKTGLSQGICAAIHTAQEGDDSLNSLSYNQLELFIQVEDTTVRISCMQCACCSCLLLG